MAAQTARPLSQRPLFVCLLLTVIGLVSLLSSSAHAEVNVAYNLDDADPAVTYSGTWTAVNNVPTALYSTLHWSNTPHNSVSASFNGTTITYFYTMASNMGDRDVYIDGAKVASFRGAASETRRQVGRTFALTTGYHTIRVEVGGDGGAYGFTDVDLFAVDIASVGIGTYDNQNAQLRYFGTWTDSTYTDGALGNTLKVTNTNLSGFRFTFLGDKVTYLFSKSTNRGKAAVTIDGVFKGYVDQYAPQLQRQQGVRYSDLGSGPHVLNIVYTGQKDPASTDTYIDVDAVLVGDLYVRNNAVIYADAWAHVPRNSSFPDYGSGPGCNDCTNYVSQVLWAGGIPEIELTNHSGTYDNQFYWYYYVYWNHLLNSRSWSATDWLKFHADASPWRYQRVSEGPYNNVSPGQLAAGDFIIMDLTGDDSLYPTHASVFMGSGYVEEGTEYYGTYQYLRSQHCTDRKRVFWGYNLVPGVDYLWLYHVTY